MPVVSDARTGKPVYLCDACQGVAHWGIDGRWYCSQHRLYGMEVKRSVVVPVKPPVEKPPPAQGTLF